MSNTWVVVALVLMSSGPAWAEEARGEAEVTKLNGPYLGQTLPAKEAVIFAPGLVSVDGRYEYALSLHSDGNQVLFTVEIPDEGATVYYSRIEGGFWTVPKAVSLTGGARKNEMEAFFSPDGSSLFFAPYDEGMDVRIWMADLTPEGWARPRPVGGPGSQDPAFYPVLSVDGLLYYTNLARRAVFRAVIENGEIIRTEAAGLERGGHAFPAPDGRYMLVDSASPASDRKRDIFVVIHQGDGTWGPATPLGATVNTEYSETCPSISPDGRFLFFSRYNEPGGLSNVYWVSSDVIDEVAPTARD